jgi:hypothetical protein
MQASSFLLPRPPFDLPPESKPISSSCSSQRLPEVLLAIASRIRNGSTSLISATRETWCCMAHRTRRSARSSLARRREWRSCFPIGSAICQPAPWPGCVVDRRISRFWRRSMGTITKSWYNCQRLIRMVSPGRMPWKASDGPAAGRDGGSTRPSRLAKGVG